MTDPRFGDRLLASVQKLPVGSAVILRHYDDSERKIIYDDVAKICRRRGHYLILAGDDNWHADGYYKGRPNTVVGASKRNAIAIIGVHNVHEIQRAKLSRPTLYILSPIFATNSHKGERPLGVMRFRQLAAICNAPVIALGGMDVKRAAMLRYAHGYAAIDGLIG